MTEGLNSGAFDASSTLWKPYSRQTKTCV